MARDLAEMPLAWWVEQTTQAWMHPMPDKPEFEVRIQARLAKEWPRLAACLEGLHHAAEKAKAEGLVKTDPELSKRELRRLRREWVNRYGKKKGGRR